MSRTDVHAVQVTETKGIVLNCTLREKKRVSKASGALVEEEQYAP
jgi:hypothetical protein